MVTNVLDSSIQSDSVIATDLTKTALPTTNLEDAQRNNRPESNVFKNTSSLETKVKTSAQNLQLAERDIRILEPDLDKTAKEHNLNVFIATAANMPQNMRNMDACTGTPMRMVNGKLVGAGDSVMYINIDKIYDPNKSKEYNRAKMLAVYAHSCYTLRQPHNPTIGQDGKILPKDTIEIQAYQQTILFLEKAAKAYSKTDPAMAKAIQEVIQEEKRDLATWQK